MKNIVSTISAHKFKAIPVVLLTVGLLMGISLPKTTTKADTCITTQDGYGQCGTTKGDHYDVTPTPAPTQAAEVTTAPQQEVLQPTPTPLPINQNPISKPQEQEPCR